MDSIISWVSHNPGVVITLVGYAVSGIVAFKIMEYKVKRLSLDFASCRDAIDKRCEECKRETEKDMAEIKAQSREEFKELRDVVAKLADTASSLTVAVGKLEVLVSGKTVQL